MDDFVIVAAGVFTDSLVDASIIVAVLVHQTVVVVVVADVQQFRLTSSYCCFQ